MMDYIYGINQMLIQCEEDTIRISPAVPDTWNDYSFHLACYGNLTATVSVKKGKITALTLTAPESATETYRTLIIPDQMIDIKKINKKAMLSIDTDNNNHHIYVKLNNKTSII
jgi:trehalose/maltose hydrolase-like predicted phosphorylase